MYNIICKDDDGTFVKTNGDFTTIKSARKYKDTIDDLRDPKIVTEFLLAKAIEMNNATL